SANTLVRAGAAWRADCTDIDGVTGALHELEVVDLRSAPPVVLGAGGTARPALVALADSGATDVVIAVRAPERAGGAVDCAERAGLRSRVIDLAPGLLSEACAAAPVVISTVPGDAAGVHADSLRHAARFLDVV